MDKKNRIKIPFKEIIIGILDFSLLKISIAVFFLLIFIYWYADSKDLWPTGPWGEYEGNHGPWRGRWLWFLQAYESPLYILNRTLWRVFELQFIALLLAGGGLLLRRALKRAFLLGLHLVNLYILFYSYYWLID
jgi:hypothetical protein